MQNDLLETAKRKTIVFDGAIGTMVMAAGLKAGASPEVWNLEKPDLIREIHAGYYAAGADVVHANTFGCNAVKLATGGMAGKMEEINRAAVRLAREACPPGKFVAGDMGPSGKMLRPMGDADPHQLEETFYQQALVLVDAGVDLISIETMFALDEALAAVKGARRAGGGIIIIASMTFNKSPRGLFTMMGETPVRCAEAFEAAGVDVIAGNCGLNSTDMLGLTAELRAATRKPILIQPNAGQPEVRDGVTFYAQSPSDFAADCKAIVGAGADMIGGCCGTTPEFIREVCRGLGQAAS